MEMWLRRISVFRHFSVNDLAERIGIERHAAVVAELRFEASRMAAYVRDTCLLQQLDDFFHRSIGALEIDRILVHSEFPLLAAEERPHDAVDHIVAAATCKADAIFVDAPLAEARDDRAQVLGRGAERIEQISDGGTYGVRTHLLVGVAAAFLVVGALLAALIMKLVMK